MSTYGTLVAEIRSDLHRGSDFDSRIKAAICAAIRHYRTERLGFNTQRSTVTTSASAEFYDLSSLNFIEIDLVRLDMSNYREVLIERTYEWIDERNYPQHVGQPCDYAIQQRQLRLYPIPDQTYSLLVVNHYDLAEISLSSSDAATNAWMTEGYDLIKHHAIADLHVNYIRGEESPGYASAAKSQEQEIFRNLKRRANRDQSTGRIRPYCI